jgi:hypothetical protein
MKTKEAAGIKKEIVTVQYLKTRRNPKGRHFMKAIMQLFLLASFASLGFAAAPNDPRQKEESDIHEAAFRYLFDHNPSVLQKRAKAYYLGIGEKTSTGTTDEFLKRFTGHKPPVFNRSAAGVSPDKGVTDKPGQTRAVLGCGSGVPDLEVAAAEFEAQIRFAARRRRRHKKRFGFFLLCVLCGHFLLFPGKGQGWL